MTVLEDKPELPKEMNKTWHKLMCNNLSEMNTLLHPFNAITPEKYKRFMEVSRDFWKLRSSLTNAVEQSGG